MTDISPKIATRHDHIIGDIRTRIIEGQWAPGFQLPIETDLAAQYGVSRMTMNKVLTQLTREGFLLRRKKMGTRVAQPRAQSAVMAIADIRDEVEASGHAYRFVLHARDLRAATDEDTLRIGAEDQQVLWLEGLHMADDAPFCLESRLVNPPMAPGVLEQDFGIRAPGAWLLHTIPWSTVRHRIRAIPVTAPDAKLLRIAPGDAGLEVVRSTQVGGTWVTWVRLLYPGADHQLIAEFAPRAVDSV